MIVEIEKPRPSCNSALNYNEGKVDRNVAELVAYRNIDDVTSQGIYELFSRYEKTRYPVREMSFHASVNPSETDTCTEDEIMDFIASLMDSLGLGEQPWLVYRHFDIDRVHYHIVSVRADRDGRKINNLYEQRKASQFIKSVAEQYHFSVPEAGESARNTKSLEDGKPPQKKMYFKPSSADRISQMKDISEYALTYDFDGISQFCCIMEGLGVRATERIEESGSSFVLRGLNSKGRPCTKEISESELGMELFGMCMSTSSENKQTHRIHRKEKERLEGLVKASFKYSKSKSHFENILRNKGVSVHYSYSSEGDLFGITLVDHRTKCVFKASELPEVISVRMMQEAVESGHWRAVDRGEKSRAYIAEKRKESREAANTLLMVKAGVISRVLKPVGQPTGSSWSGQSKKSEEQMRDEKENERSGALNSSLVDYSLVDRIE